MTEKKKVETINELGLASLQRELAAKTKPLNLLQRISAIQGAVTTVEKGANVNDQYDAVTHDDVTKMLRPLMVKYGVVSFIRLKSSEMIDLGVKWKSRQLYQLRAKFVITYVNVDDPDDCVAIPVEAHADDAGDKGPGKVLSYAQKYADLKTFRINTGEDDEQRIDETQITEPTLSEEHVTALYTRADEICGEDADDVLASMAEKVFQVDGYMNILDKHWGVAMTKLETKAPKL